MIESFSESIYSERARQVIFLARWMSGRRGSSVIEMDDLVMALLKEDQGGFAAELSAIPQFQHFKAPPRKAYIESAVASDLVRRIEATLPRSEALPMDTEIPLSPAVKEALGKAGELSSAYSKGKLGQLHLLAGALSTEDLSQGLQLLREVGVNETKILEEIKKEAA